MIRLVVTGYRVMSDSSVQTAEQGGLGFTVICLAVKDVTFSRVEWSKVRLAE